MSALRHKTAEHTAGSILLSSILLLCLEMLLLAREFAMRVLLSAAHGVRQESLVRQWADQCMIPFCSQTCPLWRISLPIGCGRHPLLPGAPLPPPFGAAARAPTAGQRSALMSADCAGATAAGEFFTARLPAASLTGTSMDGGGATTRAGPRPAWRRSRTSRVPTQSKGWLRLWCHQRHANSLS